MRKSHKDGPRLCQRVGRLFMADTAVKYIFSQIIAVYAPNY